MIAARSITRYRTFSMITRAMARISPVTVIMMMFFLRRRAAFSSGVSRRSSISSPSLVIIFLVAGSLSATASPCSGLMSATDAVPDVGKGTSVIVGSGAGSLAIAEPLELAIGGKSESPLWAGWLLEDERTGEGRLIG